MDFDKILEHIGQFGTYQKWTFCLLCFPPMIVSMNMLSYVFNSAVPKHRCWIPGCDNSSSKYDEPWLNYTIPFTTGDNNNTLTYKSCIMYKSNTTSNNCLPGKFESRETEECSSLVYDTSLYDSTVVTEWNLTCSEEWLAPLSGSLWMVGVLIGAALFGDLADRLGRRKTLLIACLSLSVTSFIVPFCPSYTAFLVVRILQAVSSSGVYQTVFVLAMEMVGENSRMFCGIFITIAFACGEVLLGILAYFFRNWRDLSLVIAVPTIFFIPFYWIVPESVRWLIANKKFHEARTQIKKMAVRNKKSVPMELLEDDLHFDDSLILTDEASKKKHSVLDLLRRPRMRRRTLNIFLNWFMNTIGYYGISMNVSNLGGNAYLDFIIVSLVELPSYFFCIAVLDRCGRRRPLICCMVFGGIACLLTSAVPSDPDLQYVTIILSTIGKFGTAAAFAIIYVFSAELFPTILRNNGVGWSSFFAHCGGVLVPYIASLSQVFRVLPLVIYGVSLFVSGVLAVFLPETLGEKLPDTIDEAENFGRKRTTLSVETSTEEADALLWNESLVHRVSSK